MKKIRIATRNSPLALWQAEYVKSRLLAAHDDIDVELLPMTTQGDQMLDRSLSKVGGKGLFLKELEVSLLNGQSDIAVHSMKDVPVDLPEGLHISAVCKREDPRDAFVSNDYQSLAQLPEGAVVGTSSLRRVAQIKYAYPHLNLLELRGNVNTRLAKLDQGQYDAIILASAGLIRLDMQARIADFIDTEVCLPAVGQGIVGIECRKDDAQLNQRLAALHDQQSAVCLAAERAMNACLEGGCQVPVAAYATLHGDDLSLQGLVASVDGVQRLYECQHETITGNEIVKAQNLGKNVAKRLIEQGARAILEECFD